MIPVQALHKAVLKAADSIESRPEMFDFHSVSIPNGVDCGTPGCAIGWVVYHLAAAGFDVIVDDEIDNRTWETNKPMNLDDGLFYRRMNELEERDESREHWSRNAASCAATLRDYATEYLTGGQVNEHHTKRIRHESD